MSGAEKHTRVWKIKSPQSIRQYCAVIDIRNATMQGKHWRAPGDLGVAVFRMEEQTTSGGAELCPMGRTVAKAWKFGADRSSAWVLKADPLKGVQSRRGH